MTHICEWCDRPFLVLEDNRCYQMDCAGHLVCLECSDLWEVEEIRLHQSKVKGVLDKIRNTVQTASGRALPVKLFDWQEARMPWRPMYRAQAVDSFGGNWQASLAKDNTITLKPIGRT